jgi:two-component sensor histidine kinase
LPKGRVDEPTITISLRQRGEELVLRVEDNGVGIAGMDSIREPEQGSLGLRIVELVARQLRGHAEIGTDGPAQVEIRFPVESTEAP